MDSSAIYQNGSEAQLPMYSHPALFNRLHSTVSSTSSSNSLTSSGLVSNTSDPSLTQQQYSDGGQTQAWWSVDEHMKPRGLMSDHQKMGMSLAARIFQQSEENWDLSDSLADLYLNNDIINKKSWSSLAKFKPPANLDDIDQNKWLQADTSHGFISVYPPDSTAVSQVAARLIPCSLAMEAHSICQAIGVPPNSLHVQLSGDIIRRLDPYEHPLVLQNEYLSKIGFHDIYRMQEEGLSPELGYLIRFYSGKPFFESTFCRNHLSANLDIRFGGVLSGWKKKLCTLTGTQLKIYKDKSENGTAQVIQLSNGTVEEGRSKTHPFHLKMTTQSSGPEKSILLSFPDVNEYSKWLKKCKKAVAKLPSNADLSNCNLEFLPETLFTNAQLSMLNLRHNALRNRPTEEDIYTIGWLEDLPRFQNLRSLNLADNNLESFPLSICDMTSLVELNLGCNKIETVPAVIGNLVNLQALHLHNNHLSSMPDEIVGLKKLVILVLAFNKFHQIPNCVAQLTDVRTSECETIIMAGNLIENVSNDVVTRLKHVKKVDLRMNNLSLTASETLMFGMLEQLTHLDLRMNSITELDLRAIKSLEYLNVERNILHTLQLNGSSLRTIFVAYNELQQFLVSPTPEWLELIDLSYNKLEKLPDWLSDCFFLKRCNVSHNKLQSLPARMFCDPQRLRQLIADHNEIRQLPEDVTNSVLEEINLHHNMIENLPCEFLSKLNKLKVLNLSSNALSSLPPLNEISDLNKLHELYLSQNSLTDSCLTVIEGCPRLKVLHLAYNELTHVSETFVKSLDLLQELNVSGNRMRSLPGSLAGMPELRLLRAHSNLLKKLPNLNDSSTLKVLDVACNKLLSISASELASSTQLLSLDMQLTQFSVDQAQMERARQSRQINSIDVSGENRDLQTASNAQLAAQLQYPQYKVAKICQIGFAESSGSRNKLCVTVVHQLTYKDKDEALFAMFDGGRNSEVPKVLKKIFPNVLNEEYNKSDKPQVYLKYAFLNAHKCLKSSGQHLGSSAAVCHIRRSEESSRRFQICLANCGDITVVLCRAGEPVTLTKTHSVVENKEEASRIFRSDGIITEDNRVNGISVTTRALGNCYLYPHLIPEPNIIKKVLRPEDQFLIMANSSLWRYLSHKEAIEEIQYIANPVVAAKRLQDLAQGYGCKENVSVLVIHFNTTMLSAAPSLTSLISSNNSLPSDSRFSLKNDSRRLSAASAAKKRPMPAPRSRLPTDTSRESIAIGMPVTVDLGSTEIPKHYDDAVKCTMNGSQLEQALQRRISQVKNTELIQSFNGSSLSGSSHNDSTSTLTGSNHSVDNNNILSSAPRYASESAVMVTSYRDSDSSLVAGDSLRKPISSSGIPKNPLYQSDTQLLHASQIELKSTNYFNRPALSTSSLEDDDEHYEYGSGRYHDSADSSFMSLGSVSTLNADDNYQYQIQEGAEGESDIYENVASIRASAHALQRNETLYENVTPPGLKSNSNNNAADFDDPRLCSINPRSSHVSLIDCDNAHQKVNIDHRDGPPRPQKLTRKSLNNNGHHISNGSSAYGSGYSMGISDSSQIDTYL